MINSWKKQQELTIMPQGNFLIVARARDVLGGIGETFTVGPLVTGKAGGIGKAEADSVLIPALYSADPNRILNSVDTLVSAGFQASGKGTVVTMLVDAMNTVVS